MKYLEMRKRWCQASTLPYGEQRPARESLARDLGISVTTLYLWARKYGWPRTNDVPRQTA